MWIGKFGVTMNIFILFILFTRFTLQCHCSFQMCLSSITSEFCSTPRELLDVCLKQYSIEEPEESTNTLHLSIWMIIT
jgi:hypothetical protein